MLHQETNTISRACDHIEHCLIRTRQIQNLLMFLPMGRHMPSDKHAEQSSGEMIKQYNMSQEYMQNINNASLDIAE